MLYNIKKLPFSLIEQISSNNYLVWLSESNKYIVLDSNILNLIVKKNDFSNSDFLFEIMNVLKVDSVSAEKINNDISDLFIDFNSPKFEIPSVSSHPLINCEIDHYYCFNNVIIKVSFGCLNSKFLIHQKYQHLEVFNENKYKFGILLQNMYYYKLNIMSIDEGNGNWPGSRVCLKKNLRSFFKFRLLKLKNIKYPFWRIDKEKNIELIKNGGWHFTYLMNPKEIIKKIESMAHSEFNKKEFKNEHIVENNIKNLKDPFGRDLRLTKVEIENSFPKYLRDNIDLYKDWILK